MKLKKKIRKTLLILSLITLLTTGILIYNILLLNNIENYLRYLGIGAISIICLLFLIKAFKYKSKKPIMLILFLFLMFSFVLIEGIGIYYINKVYSSINRMNKTEITYTTSLLTLKESNIKTTSDLKNKKIGIINNKDSFDGYIISMEIIKDEQINDESLVTYDSFLSLLDALYEKEVNAIFLPNNYETMFKSVEKFENIKEDLFEITSKEKKVTKKITETEVVSNIEKPFALLLLGVDSEKDDISQSTSFNGDSIMVITFNPNTLNTTMLSIPRDTFVPIACFPNQKQNKITHAAWHDVGCMEKTIENFTGINIDYYIKVNFKGVVDLVDAVDGVEVDIPYSFCEQDSNRNWGKNTVYVEKGLQTLDGEQALALARNRHPNSVCGEKWTNYESSDFVRGQNQQLIVQSLFNKVKTIRDINTLYNVLDLVQQNIDTNFTTNQILSFYNVGKNILNNVGKDVDLLGFEKLYLETKGMTIYDERLKQGLSNQVYYPDSLKAVVKAMKINLELEKPELIKNFSFSIKEEYQPKVIGKNIFGSITIATVPSFIGKSKTYISNWGLENGVDITFEEYETDSEAYEDGQFLEQSIPPKSLISIAKSTGITIRIVKKIIPIVEEEETEEEETEEESTTDPIEEPFNEE